jgi:hypothetical protein
MTLKLSNKGKITIQGIETLTDINAGERVRVYFRMREQDSWVGGDVPLPWNNVKKAFESLVTTKRHKFYLYKVVREKQ